MYFEKENAMGNGTEIERLWKLETQVKKLVLEGKRDAGEVADALQKILETAPNKFTLLADLGTVMVPANYVNATQLASFKKQNRKKFYYYNDYIADKNFPNPTRILKAGDKLHVRAYGHAVKGTTTTSKERMEFLRAQNSVFTGAQGASLVFEQKRQELPRGKWYASFDEPENLWAGSDGGHRVPEVDAAGVGGFGFNLGFFEGDWYGSNAFLSFSDVPLET